MKLTIIFALIYLMVHSTWTKKMKTGKLDWWQSEVIYQIYPRSFKDSNGDGIGDLQGIYEKLPYIKSLGVGAIWFSPIFTSPMVDFGYDISNFREIDPIFGDMENFEAVLKRAKKLGLKVLLDLVPNHTSDKHEWFQKSIERISPYTDYYVWKNAKYVDGVRHPPNNWNSVFSKSAWTWNDKRKQYYLHQFTVQQPDLNFRNPVVYEEMKNNLIFWLERGVDGFRIDAFNFIYEHKDYLDEPLANLSSVNPDEYDYYIHKYSVNQPECINLAKDWRSILEKYSKKGSTKFMMLEAYAPFDVIMKYYGSKKNPGSHFPFNVMMITNITRESDASDVFNVIKSWYKHMPRHGWANWVIGNHDNSRPATRFGRYFIDGLHMLQMLLPGTPIVYNGDEFGMEDTFIRWDQTVDPPALNVGPNRYKQFTRDPERSPLQWDDTENAGFTKNLHAWLPVHPDYWKVNIKSESIVSDEQKTHLHVFKDLVKLRKNIVFQKGTLHMYKVSRWVLTIVRSFKDHATYIVVVNLGSEITISDLKKVRPSLPKTLSVRVPSVNSKYKQGDRITTSEVMLRPKAALVLTTSSEDWDIDNDKEELFVPHEDSFIISGKDTKDDLDVAESWEKPQGPYNLSSDVSFIQEVLFINGSF